jgi:GNAT superfamily N-acetyltransferase
LAPELMERCHENRVESLRAFARIYPNGRVEERAGVVKVAGGPPTHEFNTVFLTRPSPDPAKTIEESSSFMDRARVTRWRIVAYPGADTALEAAALSAGLRPGPSDPGMLLDLVPPRAPVLPHGFRVRRAATPELWNTMVKVGLVGMGGEPVEDPETSFPFRLSSVHRGYVGFEGPVPVATSVGFSHRGVAGVFFVSTLPKFRGKGYGRAVTWQAVVGARPEGCRLSYLHASEMGYPVYVRMGYRPVARYREWRTGP